MGHGAAAPLDVLLLQLVVWAAERYTLLGHLPMPLASLLQRSVLQLQLLQDGIQSTNVGAGGAVDSPLGDSVESFLNETREHVSMFVCHGKDCLLNACLSSVSKLRKGNVIVSNRIEKLAERRIAWYQTLGLEQQCVRNV